jgi:hypothetical protein
MTDGAAAAPGLFLGQSADSGADRPEQLLFHRANRHGVVAGATGTGKTVTLQIMAQGFSDAGVSLHGRLSCRRERDQGARRPSPKAQSRLVDTRRSQAQP